MTCALLCTTKTKDAAIIKVCSEQNEA